MSQFYFRTSENEHIQTTVHIQPESRCVITGRVLDEKDSPVSDAAVFLYQGIEPALLLAQSFTDGDGTFCFGPLQNDTLHKIKIYKNNSKIRELEIKTEV
ncbi:MAG: carboxypeptidase regulatory-like domain-containing protein [Ruminococcaceae bacterium]|nr:carboxypeptidase regulatory-like domain-containing protein [Oscillospiraceae bacterium]